MWSLCLAFLSLVLKQINSYSNILEGGLEKKTYSKGFGILKTKCLKTKTIEIILITRAQA